MHASRSGLSTPSRVSPASDSLFERDHSARLSCHTPPVSLEPPLNPSQTQDSDDGTSWWDGTTWIPRDAVPQRQAELEREAAAQLQRDQADYATRYAEWQHAQHDAVVAGNPFATPGTAGAAPPPPPPPGMVVATPVATGRQPTGYATGIWSFVAAMLGISIAAIPLGHISRSQARKAGLKPSAWSRWGLFFGYLDLVIGIGIAVLVLWVVNGGIDDKTPVGQSLVVAGQAEQIYFDHYGSYATTMAGLAPTGYHPADGVTVVVARADRHSYCLRAQDQLELRYYSSANHKVSRHSCA